MDEQNRKTSREIKKTLDSRLEVSSNCQMGNILILFRQGERYFPDVRQDMLIRLGQFKKEQAQLVKLQKRKVVTIKNPIQVV